MPMYTIGRMARRANLSRSTLLYYDRIGLLHPSGRSSAGYRLYNDEDMRRLEKISFYRRTGASLEEIRRMLAASASALRPLLEKRMEDLQDQIRSLREQQAVIVKILKYDHLPARLKDMDKQKWVALLRAAGMDEPGMIRWHVEFERLSPQGHHDFLASLGIMAEEIKAIRKWSRNDQQKMAQ
jgi:DNA-binding transcriptional MerR regulator